MIISFICAKFEHIKSIFMKRQYTFLVICIIFAYTAVNAQSNVPAAEKVMKTAYAKAAKENKKVLLIFHASWCGWCIKMDSSLNDVACKKFFDDNFVITHLTVLENAGKKNLENPGGEELMNKYNGKDQGLPYWAILDKTGKLLFDSQIRKTQADGTVKGSNIGCPASNEEVKAFMNILRQTTTLKDAEFSVIAKRFLLNQPSHK